MRVKFRKGKQREFIKKIMEEINCPNLNELSKRIMVNYQTLKSYYHEDRLLPESLFREVLILANVLESRFNFDIIDDNWGKVKGGRIGRRR